MSTLKLAWPHNWRKQKTLLTSTNYIRCTAKPRAVTVQNDYTADPRCYKKHQNSKKYRRRGSTATKERKKTPSLQPWTKPVVKLNTKWSKLPCKLQNHDLRTWKTLPEGHRIAITMTRSVWICDTTAPKSNDTAKTHRQWPFNWRTTPKTKNVFINVKKDLELYDSQTNSIRIR